MLNSTLNYLYATSPVSTLPFSGVTVTSSVYLKGAGGESGDGFPVPRGGFLTAVSLWDGTTLRTDVDEIAVSAGDRISVYCQTTGSDFTVKVRINGASTNLQITGVPHNSTLFATVEICLLRA